MIEDYFRRSPRISAAKISKAGRTRRACAAQVRIAVGYYDLDTGKLEWTAT